MNQLNNLLRRQAEGLITPEEQAELFQLTHRDEVVQGALRHARQLRRRRRVCAAAVTSVLLVAAVVATHVGGPTESDSSPLLAQTDAPQSVSQPVTPVAPVMEVTPAESAPVSHVATVEPVAESMPTLPAEESAAPQSLPDIHHEGDAVVACNSQCSPDSVISDIWRFLKV